MCVCVEGGGGGGGGGGNLEMEAIYIKCCNVGAAENGILSFCLG